MAILNAFELVFAILCQYGFDSFQKALAYVRIWVLELCNEQKDQKNRISLIVNMQVWIKLVWETQILFNERWK